jgi:hypothetical protein
MKIHPPKSTFNDYYNHVADSMFVNSEDTYAQASSECIYRIPEEWGDGVHRTNFLRKGSSALDAIMVLIYGFLNNNKTLLSWL